MRTPWGQSQDVTEYAPGIVFVSTASHGGIKLDRKHNAMVPDYMRCEGGWYEEDCDWAIVATIFPAAFIRPDGDKLPATLEAAKRTLRVWRPDEYERYYGVVLQPGESFIRDERVFLAAHTTDWLAIAAVNDDTHPGMVKVWATLGGVRSLVVAGDGHVQNRTPERMFLVPTDEYKSGHGFSFIIDLTRHVEIDA